VVVVVVVDGNVDLDGDGDGDVAGVVATTSPSRGRRRCDDLAVAQK